MSMGQVAILRGPRGPARPIVPSKQCHFTAGEKPIARSRRASAAAHSQSTHRRSSGRYDVALVVFLLFPSLFQIQSVDAFVVSRLEASFRDSTSLRSSRKPRIIKGRSDRRQPSRIPNRPPAPGAGEPTQRRPIEPIRREGGEYDESAVCNEERLTAAIGCQHFAVCSGCTVDAGVARIPTVRSAKMFFSSAVVRRRRMDIVGRGKGRNDFDDEQGGGGDDGFFRVVVPAPVTGWRTQAKLAVSPKSSGWARDGCTFGLYQSGTHVVTRIPNCAVHHPAINRAVAALEYATEDAGVSAYREESPEGGGLRYVQFQVERATGKVCLTLVWHAEHIKEAQPSLSRLTKGLQRREPDLWHSVWLHCNDGPGNNIFARNPRRWHRLSGPEFVREPFPVGDRLGGVGSLYFSPMAFRQGNMDGFEVLARDVARVVPGGSKVCELYAGVGVLGLTALAYHALETGRPLSWIRCSDENPVNPRCFQLAVDSMPPDVSSRDASRPPTRKNQDDGLTLAELAALMRTGQTTSRAEGNREKTSYMVATAGKALKSGQALGAQVLIVDPPRKGLEEDVLDELCKPFDPEQPYVESATVLPMSDDRVNWTNDVKTLIYVSCGFDALARDSERLLSSRGGWILESATGYILFPGSDHVETLCVFRRK